MIPATLLGKQISQDSGTARRAKYVQFPDQLSVSWFIMWFNIAAEERRLCKTAREGFLQNVSMCPFPTRKGYLQMSLYKCILTQGNSSVASSAMSSDSHKLYNIQ